MAGGVRHAGCSEIRGAMSLSRRAFSLGLGISAVVAAFPSSCGPALAESAREEDAVVLARAAAVVLSAQETHVVLKPVPPRRRTQPKARPKAKGAKPAPPRMQLVLRDVIASKGGPAYDVFLVVEGSNVFQASSRREQVG